MKLILTCEHGGNKIPKPYQLYFKNQDLVLNSHRGYDLGALDVFNYLKPLSNYSKYSDNSRLLIELNRSLHHKKLFSEFSKTLSKDDKKQLISNYYLEFRNNVEASIKKYIYSNNKVLHLSVHSFTPILNNQVRHCDIGLLFDSRNIAEKKFSKNLKSEILKQDKTLNVRFNYPYLGKADGFTMYLRKQFPENYLGIEIELNQKFSIKNKINKNLKDVLLIAIKNVSS
ncbi:N-formylglutamate amidohydrolase [Lacinutrix sp.]|uniref:N-formylglutamate amidohydrolase n=1 Tax=Lacinutrix sp. TaxID=1937692 RepID=UPI00261E3FDB|nr:N-formylglutamate amidohydrolase [Lacinutrix sp.]MDG1714617.1 N-formylglutamate amidohydrolase [Lacinutrix sp.]